MLAVLSVLNQTKLTPGNNMRFEKQKTNVKQTTLPWFSLRKKKKKNDEETSFNQKRGAEGAGGGAAEKMERIRGFREHRLWSS